MNRYLYILILSMLGSAEAEAQQEVTFGNDAPRLVVNITVDNLSSEYLETFMPMYGDSGIRKLFSDGRLYTHGSYPFTPVDNASALACISTGTTPYYNGIPSIQWLSRNTLRPVYAGTAEKAQYPGAENIMTSTVGDEMKISSEGMSKVYAIAADKNTAIMAAGHAADAALWMDGSLNWTTSKYYQPNGMPWLDTFNRYDGPMSPAGTHNICTDITSFALRCVNDCGLGFDNTTDLISIEYTLTDSKNKDDIAGAYFVLDREIARLMKQLDKGIGKDNILYIFSSTGFNNTIPEDNSRFRIPSGTVFINRTAGLLNMYLCAIYGQGQYVIAFLDNQIYLDHKLIEQKHIQMSDILARSREMLLMSAGVREVYTSLDLLMSTDPEVQLLRNGFSLSVSGDIIIEVAPGWKLLNEDTGQQKQWRANAMVFPIIFLGKNINHEIVTTPVTTDQIAPTICKSIHIRAPNACKSTPLF